MNEIDQNPFGAVPINKDEETPAERISLFEKRGNPSNEVDYEFFEPS